MAEQHERKRAKRPGRLFLAACATVIAALASSVARAEEQAGPGGGAGLPWGELGAAYQRSLGESFAIETGVGYGLTGVQAALLPSCSSDPASGGPSRRRADRRSTPMC